MFHLYEEDLNKLLEPESRKITETFPSPARNLQQPIFGPMATVQSNRAALVFGHICAFFMTRCLARSESDLRGIFGRGWIGSAL